MQGPFACPTWYHLRYGPAPNYRQEETSCEISSINRASFRPRSNRVWTLGGFGTFDHRVFSAALTGYSRPPAPDVLGLLRRMFSVSWSWPGVLGPLRRAFSASWSWLGVLGFLILIECFRSPAPGVLGFLIRTGCSRSPSPGVPGLPILTKCSRSSAPGGRVTLRCKAPGLRRGQLTTWHPCRSRLSIGSLQTAPALIRPTQNTRFFVFSVDRPNSLYQ